ncbi:MAG: hypothetical protein JW860_12945 [Sedimentisphaerales bacterium]|nr:hypothetical protein [Sedimentisphaerales bacterium]
MDERKDLEQAENQNDLSRQNNFSKSNKSRNTLIYVAVILLAWAVVGYSVLTNTSADSAGSTASLESAGSAPCCAAKGALAADSEQKACGSQKACSAQKQCAAQCESADKDCCGKCSDAQKKCCGTCGPDKGNKADENIVPTSSSSCCPADKASGSGCPVARILATSGTDSDKGCCPSDKTTPATTSCPATGTCPVKQAQNPVTTIAENQPESL